MRTPRGRILVVRGGAIGDFILTLPAISALRARFPEAHLEVLGYPHIARLALEGGLVDAVQSIEAGSLAGFFARAGALDADLAAYFSGFNLIVSYLYDPDDIFRTNVGRCTRAQFIAGPHRPDERAPDHAAKVYLKPLERLAVFDADPLPRLILNSSGPPMRQLALHPGSGSEAKNWPEANWAALLRQLLDSTSLDLLLAGGEAEGQRLRRLSAPLPAGRVRTAQSLRLPDLARRLQQCLAFVGHDSGISHLAAAVGIPSLLLWGETAEALWRPPQPHVVVLNNPGGLKTLTVEQVRDALNTLLSG